MYIQVINSDEMPVHMMTCQILVCLTPECYRYTRVEEEVQFEGRKTSNPRRKVTSVVIYMYFLTLYELISLQYVYFPILATHRNNKNSPTLCYIHAS